MKTLVPALSLFVLLAGCLGGEGPGGILSQNGLDDVLVTTEIGAASLVTFKAPDIAGLTYKWDFGDLSPTKTGATVTHKYGVKSGLFPVVLTATDGNGASRLVGHLLKLGDGVNKAPTAAITLPSGAFAKTGAEFMVDGSTSADPDGDVLKITWILADPGAQAPAAPAGGHQHAAPAESADGGHAHGGGPDTGTLNATQSKDLVLPDPGTYQIHCHPHPYMIGKIVVEGGAPTAAKVDIVESSFQPPIVKVAPGGKVTFTNRDAMPHTATTSAIAPSGKVLPLTSLAGAVTLTETGPFDLVLVVEDGKGQMAVAKQRIQVVDELPASTFEATWEDGYDSVVPQPRAKRFPFEIRYPGHALVDTAVTTGTPTHGSVAFRLLDLAGTPIAEGAAISAQIPAGQYFVEASSPDAVVANIEWVSTILVHLDLSGAAAGDDGHGGHEH